MLKIDLTSASVQPEKYAQGLQQAHTWLQEATGRGNDFVGWVNLPRDYDKEEYARIQAAAKKIQSDSKPWSLSASAAAIWGRGPLSSCFTPITTI